LLATDICFKNRTKRSRTEN